MPSSVSHRDHAGIGDENLVSHINWCVSNCVIFQQQCVPTESKLYSLKNTHPNAFFFGTVLKHEQL